MSTKSDRIAKISVSVLGAAALVVASLGIGSLVQARTLAENVEENAVEVAILQAEADEMQELMSERTPGATFERAVPVVEEVPAPAPVEEAPAPAPEPAPAPQPAPAPAPAPAPPAFSCPDGAVDAGDGASCWWEYCFTIQPIPNPDYPECDGPFRP